MTNPDEPSDFSSKIRDVADDHKKHGDPTKHEPMDGKHTHVSQIVYMMPESYNYLVKYLEREFPALWRAVGYNMAFDARLFCSQMDEVLGTITQMDSGNVDGICKRYIDKLREVQGLKPMHQESEYFANTGMEEQVRMARQVHEFDTSFIKGLKKP